jgi:ATP-dependent RNA helicase DDX5/DBP2
MQLEADALRLGRCALLVLDEADKLLKDAACSADVAALREAMPPKAQTLLLSATMPPAVAAAARAWMRKPAMLGAAASKAASADEPAALPAAPLAPAAAAAGGADGTGGGGAAIVAQEVQLCAEHKKARKLLRHLELLAAATAGARSRPRVLVFVNTAKAGAFVADMLRRHGHNAALLQGSAPQASREAALTDFRCGKRPLLVATDVAGRGLHITGLERVVNWDFPPNLEAYCHRVGRAGRAGAPGHALSFFTRKMARMAPDLVTMLRQAGQPVEKHLALLADVVAEAVAKGAQLPGADEGEEEEEEAAAGDDAHEEEAPVPAKAAGRKRAAEAAAAEDEEDDGDEEEAQELRRKPLFGGDDAAPRKAKAAKVPKPAKPAAAPAAAPVAAAPAPPAAFIAAARFGGAKPGFFFGKGREGLGYHRDLKPKPSAFVLQKYGGGGGGGGKRPQGGGQQVSKAKQWRR